MIQPIVSLFRVTAPVVFAFARDTRTGLGRPVVLQRVKFGGTEQDREITQAGRVARLSMDSWIGISHSRTSLAISCV